MDVASSTRRRGMDVIIRVCVCVCVYTWTCDRVVADVTA